MSDQTPDPAADTFPLGTPYKLDSGETIRIHKWSVGTLTRFTQRVPEVVEKFIGADKEASVITLFPDMLDEITEVVAESTDIAVERIRRDWTAEDLLGVSTIVWDVCLAGLLAKTLGLTIRFQGLLGGGPSMTETPESPSSEPSAS